LFPICLSYAHEFASNATTTTTTTIITKVAREKKERKKERPGNEEILEEKRKTLFPHASVADRVPLFISFRGNAEFTSPAVADTLFRTRGRRRRMRSHERVADDTLPITRYFSAAQSEP
jgi:hypothetical protein